MIIRRAGALDASNMAALLSEIIQIGGTTALTGAVSAADVQEWMDGSKRAAWHIAETDDGELVGFQWIEEVTALPPEAAEIATFAKVGQTGLGIGSKLFAATKAAAEELGYEWIRANIRADNEGGLTYYQSRGFENYGRIDGYRMGDGQIVDKVLKRYNL